MIETPAAFLADFGEAGTLDGAAVQGIFSAPYGLAQLGIGQSTTEPRFLLPDAMVPASASSSETDVVLLLSAGAALRYPGGTPRRYRVREVQPDGTGWTTLILHVHESQLP